MNTLTLFLFTLLALVVYSAPTEANSAENVEIDEKLDLSHPIKEDAKSVESEVEIEEKSAKDDHISTETRIERSSESASDVSVDAKTDLKNVETEVSPIEDNSKTVTDVNESVEASKINEEMSEINDAAEEMSSERSITDLNDEELINNSRDGNDDTFIENDNTQNDNDLLLNSRRFSTEIKEMNEKNSGDHLNTAPESSPFKPDEIHDTLLDNKARSAENSHENLGIQANSEIGSGKIKFGSRRSNSAGSTKSSSIVTAGRSGQIFDDIPLSIPNPSYVMLNKIINQEIPQPNEYITSPITASGEYKPQNRLESYSDPISSSEFKPLEEFSANTFSNSYPYAFQPIKTTTPRPIESNRYHEIGLLPKITQPLENLKRPIAQYIGENLNIMPPIPVSYYGSKPHEQNLQFPNFNSYKTRFSQYPSQTGYYYKKCTYCP